MINMKKLVVFSLIMVTICVLFYAINYNKPLDLATNDYKNTVISYRVDGTVRGKPPSKSEGYHILSVNCSNADGTWNEETWSLSLSNITGKVKCSISFEK